MLRIEVYPESEAENEENEKGEKKVEPKSDSNTDYNTYFSLKLRKNKKIVKEETCLLDDEGHLKIVCGADAYYIILKSCYKTHIPRNKNFD